MILKDLTPLLQGVKRGGRGIAAKCPAHDDKHQSLSVCEDEGRILLKCFAGCSTETIVNKLGLSWRDLFDKNITKPSNQHLGESINPLQLVNHSKGTMYFPKSRGRIHSVYEYVDEKGRLLYENVRYYPKDFRVRRYDVSGQAVWNLDGVRRVPYRLPEIIQAKQKGTDIFLCEGEKDSDALRELGFVATSFKNWKEEFNEYIEGVHVIVVQDHDLPGITQAAEAAKILLKSAASVKILDMYPDREIPDKGGVDISDYIRWCVEAEGADPDTLKERICIAVEHMPAWKEPNAAKPEEYFIVKSGNDWLTDSRQQKAPKQLFGELWYENEVAILFADTNVGKSILAVQIADAISRGKSGDESGRLLTKVDEQKVVYFDFELTAKQFEARLSEADAETGEYKNHYRFHPNFYRAEINPDTTDFGRFRTFEDFVNHAFETTIASTGAKVLIVDNITYLRNETENARNALPMMKFLKSLKSRYDLSLLVLAHTPKRDAGKPIGRNDLQGSKMIINFCDSAFAIGESSKQTGTRYIKQIKARNTEIVYNADNVLLANIRKQSNFLEFVFGETAFEREHLRVITDDQREGLQIKVMELRDQGLTLRAIGEQLKISAMTASRYLRNVPEDDRSADTPVNSDTKDGDLGLDP